MCCLSCLTWCDVCVIVMNCDICMNWELCICIIVVRMVVVLWDDFGYAYHVLLFAWSLFSDVAAFMLIIIVLC